MNAEVVIKLSFGTFHGHFGGRSPFIIVNISSLFFLRILELKKYLCAGKVMDKRDAEMLETESFDK